MSDTNTQEQVQIPAEVLAKAKQLMEKKQANAKKAAENAQKYPGVIPDTTEYDSVAGKYITLVKCVKCGEEHSRYTSDLFQTHGLCPTCRKALAGETKKANKELLTKAMEAIKAGKID